MQPSEGLGLKECLVQLYFLLFSGLKLVWSKIFYAVCSVSVVLPSICCYNVKVKSCFLARMSFTLLEINWDQLIVLSHLLSLEVNCNCFYTVWISCPCVEKVSDLDWLIPLKEGVPLAKFSVNKGAKWVQNHCIPCIELFSSLLREGRISLIEIFLILSSLNGASLFSCEDHFKWLG